MEHMTDIVSPGAVAILEELIAIKTVTRGTNLGLIEWARDRLRCQGADCRLTYDPTGTKANLFATLGEGREGGLILSGHSDVVSVDGQNWQTDPFKAEVKDGKIYGRGSADMKGFIAVALALAPKLAEAGRNRPIHIALSYDEEIGCIGVHSLIADMTEHGYRPAACIVGEPTSMRTVIGHKGGTVYHCKVCGREAHSALAPKGVNAVEYAARLVVRLREIAERLKREEKRHPGFEIPYSTVQTGVIHGGVASNIVPNLCEFRFDIRSLPWSKPEIIVSEVEDYAAVLVREMREVGPDCDIVITKSGNVPVFDIKEESALTRHVRHILNDAAPPAYVAFGSEAGIFQQAGVPAVLCGPGSIEQAHRPDEYVSLEQLGLCETFIARLAAHHASSRTV